MEDIKISDTSYILNLLSVMLLKQEKEIMLTNNSVTIINVL